MDFEGLSFATRTLPVLSTFLLNNVEGHSASFPQFKKKRGTEYPTFLGRLFHLALESTNPVVRGNAFDILYSITTAFKKYKGPYPKTVLIKQFNDFLETDQELDRLDLFEETTFSILELARSYICNWMRDGNIEDYKAFLPRPGPGATNTPTEKTERYRPRVLYKQIDNVLDYQEWWYATPWHACLRSREFLTLHKECLEQPVARFKFVPKTFGKPRGICIEENEMQVMQQGIRGYLYSLIKAKLYPAISLEDQSINAYLALLSSIDKEDATIDMSEASDRVSRELVSWLFQDNQDFHDILMALSTRWVKPPKELEDEFPNLIPTKKFAPMGSALCFPIMTLVHYALVLSIIEHSTDVHSMTYHDRVHVYGDDIVIPSRFIQDVYDWLPKFGMKLNTTKSFYRSHFRESCGTHAFYGKCVTPVYIKYPPFHHNAKAIAAAYEVENQLFSKGWHTAASLQRAEAGTAYHHDMFVPAGLSQAGFSRPFDNGDLRRFKQTQRRKWSAKLQCYTYKVTTINKQVIKKEIEHDDDAYLRWLWTHTPNEGRVGLAFGSQVVGDASGDLQISTRLVPESALMQKKVEQIITESQRRFPTGRVGLKRESVVVHKVVLRQSGRLQQVGAAECCAFC